MTEDIILNGSVEDIIFQNNDNGYCVFTIDSECGEVTCVGIVPQIHVGEGLKIVGSWIVHHTYGRQFQVNFYEKSEPTSIEGIIKYLSSGVIKGIGVKTAKKIVKKFGADTFYVIEEKPDRLVEIKGISYEKAMMINKVFNEQHELRKVMIFLQEFGISPTYAMKIYKKYKERTFKIVRENPYRLADEVFGIGFKMADSIALNAGIAIDSPARVKAGIKFVLNKAANNGNVYLPKDYLIDTAIDLLGVNKEIIEQCILKLQIDNQVWYEKTDNFEHIYLSMYYYSENAVAKKLVELSEDFEAENANNIDSIIKQIEIKENIELADNQRQAVKEAMCNGLLIITGGPGTGKTTTINTIIKILLAQENEVLLAAPTGRAAKRMTEATGMEAQTIHRLLGITFIDEDSRRQTFDKNEKNPIDADVLIIDETSMVDINLMYSLLRAVAPGTRVIFVGDVDQLPSVGAGNVLRDMIDSEKLKVVRLNKIFRQAQESAIIMNAHRINKGEDPILNDKEKDFFFLKRAYIDDVVTTIQDLVTRRLPNFTNCNSIEDIQILTPMRRSPVGVYNLNTILQQVLNPPSENKKEKELKTVIFREGDKVMQIKNNYNMEWVVINSYGKRIDEGVGIFNGDQGTLIKINEVDENIIVKFDDNKYVSYDFTQLDELELAYAITIHKSQGSEYPIVIIPIHSGPPMLMSRNLLYTAVTRAKKLVVIVGLQETVSRMIANKRGINRFSSLKYRIKNFYDFAKKEVKYD